jgi:hypothetical protein
MAMVAAPETAVPMPDSCPARRSNSRKGSKVSTTNTSSKPSAGLSGGHVALG